LGRGGLADQYERRASRQRGRRRRRRRYLPGLQLDREGPGQRHERLDHLDHEVNSGTVEALMRRLPGTLALLGLTLGASPAAAQWGVSAEFGVARFGGTSRDSSGATVGPYRPTTFGLHLDRGSGRVRVGVGVLYAKTGLAAEGRGVAVVQNAIGSRWEIAPGLSLRVSRFGPSIEARVDAGPPNAVWNSDGHAR